MPPNGADDTSGLVTCQDIVNIGGLTLHGQTFGLAKYIDGTFIRFKDKRSTILITNVFLLKFKSRM